MPRSIKPRGPTIATGHLDCQQCTIAMANVAVAVTNAAVIGTSALTTTMQMWACIPCWWHDTVAAEATTAAASES